MKHFQTVSVWNPLHLPTLQLARVSRAEPIIMTNETGRQSSGKDYCWASTLQDMTVDQVEPLRGRLRVAEWDTAVLCWLSWIHFSHLTDSWSIAAEKSHYAESFQSSRRDEWKLFSSQANIQLYVSHGFISLGFWNRDENNVVSWNRWTVQPVKLSLLIQNI